MTAQIILKRCKCEIIRNCGCIDDLTDTQNFDFSIIPDVIVVDLVWLNHDAWHVSTERVRVILLDFFLNRSTASARDFLDFSNRAALFDWLLRKNYWFIRYLLNLWCQLLNSRLGLLQCFVEFFIDENVVFIGNFQICVLFLERLEVIPWFLELFLNPLDAVL